MGVGKERRTIIIVHGDAKAALVTRTTLRTILALCQRTLGSERHRYAIACPDKLWTDPMVCGGKKYMDAAVDIGRNPVSKADTRRDGQICLAKPYSQARTGTRKCFPVQLTMDRIGKLARLICTLI